MEDDQIKIYYKKGEIIFLLLMSLMSLMMWLIFVVSSIRTMLDDGVLIFIVCIALGTLFFGLCFIGCGVDAIRKMLFYVILKGDTFIIRNEKGEKYEFQLSNIKKILERREHGYTRRGIPHTKFWFIIVLESDVEIKLYYTLKNLDKLAQYFIEKRESGQITRKVLPKGVERMLCKYKNEGEKMDWR